MRYAYAVWPKTGERFIIVSENNVTFFLRNANGEDVDEWVPFAEDFRNYPREQGFEVVEIED